jgi:hypothetical protein
VYTRSATAVAAAAAAKQHQQQHGSETFIDYSDIVLDGVTIPDAVFSVAIEPQLSSQQVSFKPFIDVV